MSGNELNHYVVLKIIFMYIGVGREKKVLTLPEKESYPEGQDTFEIID